MQASAPAAWLLLRIEDGTFAEGRLPLPDDEIARALVELRAESLVEPDDVRLTPAGETAVAGLVQARRAEVEEILRDWDPDEQPEVRELIDRFARSLGTAPPQVPSGVRS